MFNNNDYTDFRTANKHVLLGLFNRTEMSQN